MTDDDTERARALAASIDAHPEALHADYTAEVRALIAIGLPSLEAVLPLLMAEAELTRLRAQRTLEGVTRAWAGAHATGERQAWERLWAQHGSYDWRAPAQLRAASVRQWQAWLSAVRAR
ncbi:MAG: hypothetical protein AB7S63_13510 [Thauera sp.]|jgi:hypothetical protein